MWAFERKTIAEEDISKGPLPKRFEYRLLFALFISSLILYSFTTAYLATPISAFIITAIALLARCFVLDLRHMVLPDIYILPLAIIGVTASFLGYIPHLTGVDSLIACAVTLISTLLLLKGLESLKLSAGMGGGDIKLIAAAAAWIGLSELPFFLMIACFFTYPLLKFYPKDSPFPFGPGLILSLILFIIFPNLGERLILLFMH